MRVTILSLVFLLGKQVQEVDGFSLSPFTCTNQYAFLSTIQRNDDKTNNPHHCNYINSSKLSSSSESLSDMEDRVENQLDKDEPLETNVLQHRYIAPTKTDSSSGTLELQERGMHGEDVETQKRQEKINEILDEEERQWREVRRRKQMGKFADVETQADWERLKEEEKKALQKENDFKAQVAANAGVEFSILEKDISAEPSEDIKFNISPKGWRNGKTPWFDEPDINLKEELKGIDTGNEELPAIVDGKLVSPEAQLGFRVGSAGGWSLEVFPGDFVVHRKFGIGRFDQIVVKVKAKLTKDEKLARNRRRNEIVREMLQDKKNATQVEKVVAEFGSENDKDPVSNPMQTVLEVSYGDGKVHIPVDKAYRLSRYRAGDSVVKPRLSRIKGEAWARAKRKVEADTVEMAQDVLALYATRETLQRPPFDPIKEVQVREFEKTFAFEPTPDQQKCFEAIENDMVWRGRPMDRLICGDVGFGKTEVALRGLFRCISNGRQAALLAPTGVLASQHFKTLLKRMGPDTDFGFNIAMLRGGMGKNTKVGKAIRKDIESGDINLIVGTHALLSSDLNYKDLGLLVVDEEQRFGVKQKERLKLICGGIDVLTLSATPIPRTLQMSLSGIRDTSTIRSPPPMRKPTITHVHEFDKLFIKEALQREFARNGQCYFVVPRIAQLETAEDTMKELFPGIKIIQAHGRMARGVAEENVAAFAEGNYDVLLATTVIENGVDIPSVNTIIINNAQAFGLSTLYQLRGRVGRSNVQAHAYFLHKEESITEQSAMRLQAMADLSDLGSGFDVANRDLEIRGAGSLLGTEQSGMAAKVGFDLYMRMLKKSIRQLRGLDLPRLPRTNVLLPEGEGSLEIAVGPSGASHSFRIPKSYISDDSGRSKQEGVARLAENTGQLVELTNKWKEEYGPLPMTVQRKLKTLHLHACTRTLGIDLVGFVDKEDGTSDCVLRSPGLRPRHWVHISQSLPKGVPTKGLDVIFPSRFGKSGADIEIKGGKAFDVNALSLDNEDNEEEWDALDEEEVEAMKEISSAMFVKDIDEVDLEEYPRFVLKNLSKVKKGSRVDALLKVLLPASRVVHEKQEADKEKAKMATELRGKREIMRKQKKELEASVSRRTDFTTYM